MNNTTQPTGTIQAGQSTYLNDINKGLPIGTSSSFSQTSSTPVNQVVDASKVSDVNPIKVPETTPPLALGNLDAHLSSVITPPSGATVDSVTGTAITTPETTQGANKGVTAKLSALYDKLTGKGEFETNLQQQEQVSQKQQAAVDTFNQYNTRRLATAKQEQDFLNTNTGQSTAQKDFQIGEIRRNNAYELANLAISNQAASGNYKAALETIKMKTDAVYDPIQKQIENLEKFYTLNQNDLSESEKMTLQTKIDEQKAQKKVLSDAYESTLKTLAENGAPSDVYTAVDKASKDPNATASTIIASAGKYSTNLLDKEYKQAQITNLYKDIEKKKAELAPQVGGDNPQLYTGLKPATATAVRSQVGAFKTEPLVQNFGVIQEGRNFAGSLANDTKNPADDQALIYSLAKALDPGSVVREGEYATAQKYAQSWLAAYGKGVTQALAGTGFLSETARKNIKDTIETKYKSSLRSYDNLANQYEKGINDLTGRQDGSKFIRSYITPSAGQTVKAPDGQEIIITD